MLRAQVYRRTALAAVFLGVAIVTWWLLSRTGFAPDEPPADAGVFPSLSTEASQPPAGNIADARVQPAPDDPSAGSDAVQPAAPALAAQPSSAIEVGRSEPAKVPAAGFQASNGSHPLDWSMCFRQSAGDSYLFASDFDSAWSGSASARIGLKTKPSDTAGAGICQAISASEYSRKRIQLSMHLKTRAASPGAHMLFRADAADGRIVAFYNMEPRWITGTSDWKQYSVIIDVPESATAIVVGASLVSAGDLWIDDVAIEVVGKDKPLTQPPLPLARYNNPPPIDLPQQLRNPGFEDTSASMSSD